MLEEMIEYINIHLTSLRDNMEAAQNHEPLNKDEYDESDDYFIGAISTAEHLLSVANDILTGDIQGKGY